MISCCKETSRTSEDTPLICSQKVFYGVVITALVLTILGGLALAGFLHPETPFAGLALALGEIPTYTILGVGLSVLLVAVTARMFYRACRPEVREEASKRPSLIFKD